MRRLFYISSLFFVFLTSQNLYAQDIDIQHWQTSQGTRVYFIAAPELPMLDVRVVFAAGSTHDDALPGLAALTNTLLDKGADGMDADTIAQRMDGLGAHLGAGSERDMAWLSLRTLSQADLMDDALQVFASVLSHADFNESDFKRERERTLIGLKMEQERPGAIASRAFYRAIYNKHPYATSPAGNRESVEAIRLQQVKAFYQRYYVAQNAVVSIVGDVDREQAEAIARRITRDLPKGHAAAALASVADLETGSQQYIHHPSQQSHLLMGQPGVYRGDPDYYALYTGNYILGGGGLVSRMSDEVREKRGLAYSAYSYFLPMQRKGPFMLGLQTRNDQVGEALQVARKTLTDFVTSGPTEDEVEAAIQHITGGFPLRIDSNGKMIGYLSMIGFYGLPLSYLEDFNGNISRLTRDEIHDAFRRRINPDRMVTIVVGGEDIFKGD
ncbi:MAG: insulinase family protein [Gammaproteobacteria bacterium]|nr:insulinase family protein [Gammaproteobacteria bacterium]